MKRKITILTLTIIFYLQANIFGQNVKEYMHRIIADDLEISRNQKKEYFNHLTEKEQYEVIEYLADLKTNGDFEVRSRVASLFSLLPDYLQDLNARQMALYHAVDMSFIANYSYSCYPRELFTDRTVNRIVELIEKGIKDDELLLLWNDLLQDYENYTFKESKIKKMQEKLQCDKETAIDSLTALLMDDLRSSFQIPVHLSYSNIQLLGWLNKKEYAPLLENMLDDTKDKNWNETIILTLARLEYKNYIDKVIIGSPKNAHILAYLNNQNLYWKFIMENNSLETIKTINNFGDDSYSTNLSIAIFEIIKYIVNFPEESKFYGYVEKTEEMPNLIEKTQKAFMWLEENKGNYEIKDMDEFCL